MKRNVAILISALFVLSLATMVLAAEMMQKGTIKDVDSMSGTITFCPEGTATDMTLKADKGVDLSTVKPGTNAEVTVEKNMVKGIREIKRSRPSVGC